MRTPASGDADSAPWALAGRAWEARLSVHGTTEAARELHAHFDHTGGLHHFPHAEGYVGAGELAIADRSAMLWSRVGTKVPSTMSTVSFANRLRGW
ncbi:hypothetical protein ABZZ79_05525 [Streptomyces sp. NPDC006458]|uniref:hypothetical protein n=1 Tax=Streptomyces sp. NPDC006458 TaxID=3154302 RepID=UPI0033ABDD45